MADDNKHIKKLVRDDYEHPALQLLIAEIIYKTRNQHTARTEERFDAAMRAILGAPKIKKKEHTGRCDDDALLIKAAAMMKKVKHMSENEACERVVKYAFIEGYRAPLKTLQEYRDGIKKQDRNEKWKALPHNEKVEIRSIVKRLKRKLKKDGIEKYANQELIFIIDQLEFEERFENDIQKTKSLISKWLDAFC